MIRAAIVVTTASALAIFWMYQVEILGEQEVPPLEERPVWKAEAEHYPQQLPLQRGLWEFDAISQRPLFLRSRRPPEEVALQQSQPMDVQTAPEIPLSSTAEFRLAGTVSQGSRRIAVIVSASGSATQRVAEGDTFGGWIVEEVQPRRVVLSAHGTEAFLDMVLPTIEQEGRSPAGFISGNRTGNIGLQHAIPPAPLLLPPP